MKLKKMTDTEYGMILEAIDNNLTSLEQYEPNFQRIGDNMRGCGSKYFLKYETLRKIYLKWTDTNTEGEGFE